jgi:hypothetical protein
MHGGEVEAEPGADSDRVGKNGAVHRLPFACAHNSLSLSLPLGCACNLLPPHLPGAQ